MSTLQATNLKHNASASNNITLDSAGNATFAGNVTAAGNVNATGMVVPSSSFLRNRIINGDMRIDQRNAGVTSTVSAGSFGYFTVDRWAVFSGGGSTQLQRVAGLSGFDSALEIRPQAGTNQTNLEQRIEATNCQDLVSAAATVSGRFFADGSGVTVLVSWYYPASRDNWSSVTFVPIETITLSAGQHINYARSFNTDANAARGMGVVFDIRNAAGRTVRITGVQLEVGSAATPFERRLFGQELALCQRYYSENTSGYFPNNVAMAQYFKVSMRTAPTVTWAGAGGSISSINTESFVGFSSSNATARWTASSEL
ncbi:hypothetical protein UFOVP397_9 [uncultured Caudovirales phage]|uniref:Uncharacterized protein n=1 Tax=uncultured Caudovirales phage TaxID=2100421 RepID=A0A6J5M316_9CAUD|nr:hypothetical protein UFOVP397_9 [uncultured Caudovirales phage]